MIEYAGTTVQAMTIEQRLTLCNMAIEAGARSGMVAPDDTSFAYLHGRPFAPKCAQWDRALAHWRRLPSDADAVFDRELALAMATLAPMVTCGNSPEDAAPVDGRVPDPAAERDPARRAALLRTLDYMGLKPGMALTDIAIDLVFITARAAFMHRLVAAHGFTPMTREQAAKRARQRIEHGYVNLYAAFRGDGRAG